MPYRLRSLGALIDYKRELLSEEPAAESWHSGGRRRLPRIVLVKHGETSDRGAPRCIRTGIESRLTVTLKKVIL